MTGDRVEALPAPGGAWDVFRVFLRLGLTAFGGPIAHVAHFRRVAVAERGWLDDARFAQLLTICQFLPGPASSQLGFSLGLLRAGWPGALAAFVAFTLPSALLMALFAGVATGLDGPAGQALIHGLKLVALVVVAHGVAMMARRLCPDVARALIAGAAALLALAVGGAWAPLAAIVVGAAAGLGLGWRGGDETAAADLPVPHGPVAGTVCLVLFAVLLAVFLGVAGGPPGPATVAARFYQAGALVFGGGHVVLPLLQEALVQPGWLDRETFLAGYGAAQAVPGPMFTLSAYLGASLPAPLGGAPGALIALTGIFLPGFLLVGGVLPFWQRIAQQPLAFRGVRGANAAVVGVLAATLYDPLWVSAVGGPVDIAVALAGLAWLVVGRGGVVPVIALCVVTSLARGLLA